MLPRGCRHPRIVLESNYHLIHTCHTYIAGPTMEQKTARLTILIDPGKKKAFEELCSSQDLTSSQVVRKLIRDYLQAHDVTYPGLAKPSQ